MNMEHDVQLGHHFLWVFQTVFAIFIIIICVCVCVCVCVLRLKSGLRSFYGRYAFFSPWNWVNPLLQLWIQADTASALHHKHFKATFQVYTGLDFSTLEDLILRISALFW